MKYFIYIALFFFAFSAHSSHIVGGEMFYDCLGGNQYRVTVKLYRDCNSTGANFDQSLPVSIFDGNNNLISVEQIPYPGSQLLPVVMENACVEPPTNICIEEAVYEKIITLPNNVNGFTLSYQRCCRGANIINLLNPENAGLTLVSTIPAPSIVCNSSPRFINVPPLVLCNNDDLVFNHAATDADGDELVYELCTPFTGGTNVAPAPNPASNPPYTTVNWENGFAQDQAFGASGSISINSTTGELICAPLDLGNYAVGVCVKEYRNGVLISTTTRDFLFRVINCNILLNAELTEQEQLSTFVSYCQGLTVNFENASFGGTNYLWDFGVDNLSDDVSTSFEPTYTYPDDGIYDVTLIVNPGWPCSDTTTLSFEVHNIATAFFPEQDSLCVTNNVFDFEGSGNYDPAQATYLWEFGPNANMATANTENAAGIVFNESGTIPVTFSVDWGVCSASYTDSVFLYKEPVVGFTVPDDLSCAPYFVLFTDTSSSDTPLMYNWTFGDGSTSTLQNPSHLYQNSGLYDVSLNITTDKGCVADITALRVNAIDVKPKPNSNFSIDPAYTDIFNTTITFEDLSGEGVEHYYYFNDTVFTTDRFTTFNYIDGGFHTPYQLLVNEFGCRDSSFKTVYVKPATTFYVPNSFTPNGDGVNDQFKPVLLDATDYEISIYNRWGEKIYYSEDKLNGWAGNLVNGQNAQDGTYNWIIRFVSTSGIKEEHLGHVTLLR